MDSDIALETPLMHVSKAQSWRLAERLGEAAGGKAGGAALVELVNEHSHTCYLGVRGARHDWGYGCGACPACVLRARGWAGYRGAPAGRDGG